MWWWARMGGGAYMRLHTLAPTAWAVGGGVHRGGVGRSKTLFGVWGHFLNSPLHLERSGYLEGTGVKAPFPNSQGGPRKIIWACWGPHSLSSIADHWCGFGLVWFGLASTWPVVSGVTLTVHARPKAWECGFVTHSLSRTYSRAAPCASLIGGADCRPLDLLR